MTAGYVFIRSTPFDRCAFYGLSLAMASLMAEHGGRTLVHTARAEAMVGSTGTSEITLIAFPDMSAVDQLGRSPERKALQAEMTVAGHVEAWIVPGRPGIAPLAPSGVAPAYLLGRADLTSSRRIVRGGDLLEQAVREEGGRVLIRSNYGKALLGSSATRRLTVLEFPSLERLQRALSAYPTQQLTHLWQTLRVEDLWLLEGKAGDAAGYPTVPSSEPAYL